MVGSVVVRLTGIDAWSEKRLVAVAGPGWLSRVGIYRGGGRLLLAFMVVGVARATNRGTDQRRQTEGSLPFRYV